MAAKLGTFYSQWNDNVPLSEIDNNDPRWFVSTSAAQLIQNVAKYNEPAAAKKQEPKKAPAKEKEVVLNVPICCTGCVDTISTMLRQVSGVTSVECNIYKEKVTVKGKAAPAELLKVCRKLFKKSKISE